jgi:uncharacterized protein YjbJ (UPF0337 family)
MPMRNASALQEHASANLSNGFLDLVAFPGFDRGFFCLQESGELPPLLESFEHRTNPEDEMVDKDRVKGSAGQAKGKVKEWAGKVTGDKKTETEGKADQVKGKVRNAVGGLKDTMRGK